MAAGAKPKSQQPPKPESRQDREIGSALRAAYQRAVEEEIPQEMLDLLGKLG